MLSLRKMLGALVVLLMAAPAIAAPTAQTLAMIGEDQGGGLSQLSAIVDSESLRGILFRTIKATSADSVPLKRFSLAELSSPSGVVLVKDQGYDAILLKTLQATEDKIAVQVRYLQNAMTGAYGSCALALEKNDSGVWALKNRNGSRVSRILVKTWSMGITALQGVCQ